MYEYNNLLPTNEKTYFMLHLFDISAPLILHNLLIGVYSFEYPEGLTLQCNLYYGSSDYRRKLFFSTNVYEYRDWINYVVNYNYPANRKLI